MLDKIWFTPEVMSLKMMLNILYCIAAYSQMKYSISDTLKEKYPSNDGRTPHPSVMASYINIKTLLKLSYHSYNSA